MLRMLRANHHMKRYITRKADDLLPTTNDDENSTTNSSVSVKSIRRMNLEMSPLYPRRSCAFRVVDSGVLGEDAGSLGTL